MKSRFYAVRHAPTGGKRGVHTGAGKGKSCMIYMHRVITNAPKGMEVDHKSGETLDNTKSNLRICTRQQNRMNSVGHGKGSSVYKGVSWVACEKKWYAEITLNHREFFLGSFKEEIDAAKAYDKAAFEYFKEFARPNFQEARI
jgi:hypothetical protein